MAGRVHIDADASIRMARLAGETAYMDQVAAGKLAAARALAAPHIDTSAYANSLYAAKVKGRRGVTDREVGSTDPAALEIEYGFTHRSGTKVDGQHILGRAVFGA